MRPTVKRQIYRVCSLAIKYGSLRYLIVLSFSSGMAGHNLVVILQKMNSKGLTRKFVESEHKHLDAWHVTGYCIGFLVEVGIR